MKKKQLLATIDTKNIKSSKKKIDVLIPAIDKDSKVLPLVIDGIRKFVKHPLGNIYIVSPKSSIIKKICKEKKCKFIFEDNILPITKKDIDYTVINGTWDGIKYEDIIDRSGWLYQQLLKLSGDIICKEKYYLVVDADTVFITPHVFIRNKKMVFYCPDNPWHYKPIFDHYEKLLGQKAIAPVSLINHYMLFSKKRVLNLKKTIEERHGKAWYEAIIDLIDKTDHCSFSEYETYGNYVLTHFPKEILLAYGRNRTRNFDPKLIDSFSALDKRRLAKKFNTISFHSRGK